MIDINIYPRYPQFEDLLELYPPQPANKFLPEWYKKNKISNKLNLFGPDKEHPHAKNCPAIQEEMLNGIVLPAWSDIWIDMKDNEVNWKTTVGENFFIPNWKWIGSHNLQQIKSMNLNTIVNFGILKLFSPYYFSTPKGYGLSFRDVFYHHRKDIRLLPGMVETDIWHEVNFPFEFTQDITNQETKFIIEAGSPLMLLTPYKINEKYNLKLNKFNDKFYGKQKKNTSLMFSISNKWFNYKKLKRDML